MTTTKKKPKAKATPKIKNAPKMRAASKVKAHRQKLTREESQNRQDDALEMHEAGDSFKEITQALGFANPGHAYNAAQAARKRAAA